MTGPAVTNDWERLLSNIPLPEQNLAGIAAGAVLQRLGRSRLSAPSARVPVLIHAAGVASLGAGGALVVWSWFAARGIRLATPGVLLTSGPYAFSRNPMYVGWALVHLGIGLMRGNGWILAALPAASAAVHREVLREEERLAGIFGDSYMKYRQGVPRYVGLGMMLL